MESTPSKDSSSALVDPATVSVIGAVKVQGDLQSPSGSEPSTKKLKKDKPSTSKSKTVISDKSATDSKIAELDQKWSDRFNRLEALLMARTFESTFGTVKVTPTHSPPAIMAKDTQPFIDPAKSPAVSSEWTGKGTDAVKHQSTSQLQTGSDRQGSSTTECTGKDFSAAKHQSTSQLQTGSDRQGSSTTECTGKDFSAAKHQSTSQLQTGTDRPRSSSSQRTGKDFSAKKHQSTSQLQTDQLHTDRPKSSNLTAPTLLLYTDLGRTVSPA